MKNSTTLTQVTEMEAAVMQGIAQNEYNLANYGKPGDASWTMTYTWTLADGLYILNEGMKMPKGKSLSGVISSLTQKGLVKSCKEGPKEDHWVVLTDKGFEIWKTQISK